MRRLRIGWWGLPLIALIALAGWFAAKQARDGDDAAPPGAPPQEARAPDAARPADEPLPFKAARQGERITLSGSIPEEARNPVLEQVKQAVPNAAIVDDLKAAAALRPGLAEAAAFGLRQLARLSAASVEIRDGVIVIAGLAPDAEAYNAIVGVVAKPPEGYRLDLDGFLPPIVQPYTWSASIGETDVILTGHVPSEAARQDVRAAAAQAFPDKRLVENLQPASGLPADVDFAKATRFALAQLAQLGVGTAELVDATLSLRGDVTDKETLASVRAAVGSDLPPGLRAGALAVAVRPPSPYAFRARREAGTLTLTGYYPDQAARAAIDGLIRHRFFNEQVVDKLRPADGAPKGYLAGVSFGLEHLSRLASGEVVVRDTSVEVKGEALYEQTAEQTARAVRAVSLPGWTGKAEVRLRSSEKASAEP